MERIAKETYEGKLQKGDLDPGYILETYKELNNAAGKGYGKDWLKVNKSTGTIAPEVLKMQQNLYKFSGAKSYTMLEEINQILQKNKSWNDFKNEVLKLNPKYNVNYLQSEWQTSKQSALHASNWEHYLDNTKLYPNLKYKTQNDGKVRDAHIPLHDIIAPVNSDFWKTHYPPNGWRCRCYVVQTAEAATEPARYPKLSEKEFPLEFRGNTGISGEIFKEDTSNKGKPHPYFALARTSDSETQKAFELSKVSAPLNLNYTAKNGSQVRVSPFADLNDYEDNLKDAVILADKMKLNIDIPAHLNGRIIKNVPNPEYIIDGKKGDRKTPETQSYKKRLSSANAQGCEVVVMNLSANNDSIENAYNKIDQILKFDWVHTSIKEVYIIKGSTVKLYKRKKAE